MTDTNKLAELIKKAKTKMWGKTFHSELERNMFVADHLLANGVIVPPCKVGDKVYVIEPCSCFCGYRTFEECHHRRTNATKWIKAVMVANKHHNRCMKLFERPYKPEYYFKIGKWVFLTKEEAEAELRKRSKDNA
jgi:maltooligosyltrehalose synthase